MPTLKHIVDFLDSYLEIWKDYNDHVLNGLVLESKSQREEIRTVCFSCDVTQEVIKNASLKDADMLVVHHGVLMKDKTPVLRGVIGSRVKMLLKQNISLYVAHLPLDFHKKIGNNIALAERLALGKFRIMELKDPKGEAIGSFVLCELDKTIRCEELARLVSEKLKTRVLYQEVKVKHKVRKVAIASGSAMALLENIAECVDIDAFICGEGKHSLMYHAKELGVNVIYAGHYQTEKFGLLKLKKVVENNFKNLKTVFIDNPPLIREVL